MYRREAGLASRAPVLPSSREADVEDGRLRLENLTFGAPTHILGEPRTTSVSRDGAAGSYNGALNGAPAGGYADTHGLAGHGAGMPGGGGGLANGARPPTLGTMGRTAGGAGQYTTAGRGGAGGEGGAGAGMAGMRGAVGGYSNRGGSITPGAGHSGAMTPQVRRCVTPAGRPLLSGGDQHRVQTAGE